MTLDDMPLFAMLKSKLNYLSNRQQLIAQNVANADTPNYSPQDMKPFTVSQPGAAGGAMSGGGLAPVSISVTSPMHLAASGSGMTSSSDAVTTPDSEATLNGNSVVLEEEMEKMSEARTDFDAAIGLYQKSMSLIQMAAKRPGQ